MQTDFFSSPTVCFRTKTIISCRTSHFLLQTIIFYSSQIFILKGRRTAVRNADFQPVGAAKKAQERNVFSFQFLFDEFPFRRDKYNSPDRTQLFRATGYSIYSKTSVWCWRKTAFSVSSLATLFLYRTVLLDPNCENKICNKINPLPEPSLRVRPSLSWLTNAVTNDLMISKYRQTFLCEHHS